VSEVTITRGDDPRLDAFYAQVYLPAFAHQREPIEAWRAALAGAAYDFTLIVDEHDGRIDGGIVFERYPRSGCALLTYLVVAPHARRTGLGARLLARARADVAGARLVLGEVHDPAHADDPAAARARIAWFARRGARVVDVRYVQPDLGFGRDPHLRLIAFTDGDALDGAALRAFLREFYEVVEGAIDADTEAMLAAIAPRVSLRAGADVP
jgi:N-acetylglutamate synthase-like GNAT family acetyltransferase